MPRAVDEFVRSQNIARVCDVQRGILRMYRWDISKYAERNRQLHIKEIFDQMPAQLDSQSKRFSFASLAPRGTYERYEEDFIWLVDAGVALPVRNVVEPKRPLKLVENRSFFKLFMNDVGLLAAACGMDATRDALFNDATVSYGAMYENVVAQELASRGKGLYFFRNRSLGELDFVIEREGAVLPIEVKPGKAYRRHSALTAALKVENWGIKEAVVLCEDNLSVDGPVVYAPVYMMAFL